MTTIRRHRRPLLAGTSLASALSLAGLGVGTAIAEPLPPAPPLDFVTIDYGSNSTFFTGIRGDNLVGNYVIPGSSDTGGLLYRSDTGIWTPFVEATENGVNYPDAYSSSPYGPSFGSMGGILRVAGVYKTGSSPYNLGYLYDGAAAPGAQPITLIYPESDPSEPTLFTFPHSQFGNTVVGDYDTGLKTGNVFIYDIPTGTFTTNNKPGAVSTTAYGIYGDKIAGGYGPGPGGEPGFEHGYIYDRPTDTWTTYDHPDAFFTHFEGISGAGRGGEYNLVVDWIGVDGQQAAVLHIDAEGNETWIPLEIEGATTVSANSIYGDTAVGIYTDANGTHAYSVKIPGIYNPLTNSVKLESDAADAVLIAAEKGDDVINDGTIRVTGARGIGIRGETYGVLNNYGKVVAKGDGGAAVDMNGEFGTLLNGGIIKATKGADAVRAEDSTAMGSVVVNQGVIDGRVRVAAGEYTRFENSGWLGVSGDGAGTRHVVYGVYAQTADGVLAVRVKGARNDVLEVDTGRLDGTLAAVIEPGKGLSRKHTIVAGQEITGTFAKLDTYGLPDFVKASLDYSATAVKLKLKANLGEVHDLTRNERSVGNAIDRVFNQGGDIPDDIAAALFALAEEDLPAALNANSGEIYASQQSVLINQGLFIREALLGRVRQSAPGGGGGGSDLALAYADVPGTSPTDAVFAPDPAFWAQGLGAWGKIDSDGNAAEVTSDFGGLVGGLDIEVGDDWTVGVAFGYTSAHTDIDDPSSSADTQSGIVGAYAGGEIGAWRLRGGGSYGLNFIDTNRSVDYGNFSDTTKASYQAGLGQLFGEVGYAAELQGVSFEPFAGLAWAHLHSDSFTEKGGSAALSGDSSNADVGYTTLGIRVAAQHVLSNGMVIVPRASVAWQYAFGDLTPEASLSFADASDIAFTTAGAPIAQNAALIDAGVDLAVSSNLRLGLSYYGQLSSEAQESAVRGTLTLKF